MNRRRFLGLSGISLVSGCQTYRSPDLPTTDTAGRTAVGTPSPGQTTSTTTDRDGSTPAEATATETTTDDVVHAKVDLHAHLRRGGGQAMADRYAELGFDALVGTDHNYDVDLPGGEHAEEVEDYSDLEFPGPIIDGVEASENRHVNVFKSENRMLKQINHPMRYDLSAEEIRSFAEEIGADLVEVTNHAERLADYPTVADVASDLELHPTITSDAHDTEAVGEGYVVVEVPELTGDEILRALEAGEYAIGGKPW